MTMNGMMVPLPTRPTPVPSTPNPFSFFTPTQQQPSVPLHPLIRAVISWCQLHQLPYLCASFARSSAADLYALTKMDCIAFASGDVIKGTFLYNLIQGFKAGIYSLPIQMTNPNAVIPSSSSISPHMDGPPHDHPHDDDLSLTSNGTDHAHHHQNPIMLESTMPPLYSMSIPTTYNQDYYLHPTMHPNGNTTSSPQLASFPQFQPMSFHATSVQQPSPLQTTASEALLPSNKRKISSLSLDESMDKQTRAILALQGIASSTEQTTTTITNTTTAHTTTNWIESDENNTPQSSPLIPLKLLHPSSHATTNHKKTKLEPTEEGSSSDDEKRDKPYKCDKCGRGFTVVYSLEAHYRIHTGEKPYKCQFCARAFTQSGHLTVHERTHTGERPFKCSYCEKTFARPDLARRHERVHTGERPFPCHYCDKAFTTSGNRKVHERRIHADQEES